MPMRTTPLDDHHRSLGAKMIPFAGWEMPVQYTSLVEEHTAVRTGAGLFDLSHMGELMVSGPGAAEALDYALVTAPSRLKEGRAHYSMICAPDGSVIDDLIVYRIGEAAYMVVANASNREAVVEALVERLAGHDANLRDASMEIALVAIQGPASAAMLARHTDTDLEALKYYAIVDGAVAGIDVRIARTGYTGEDGFELYVPWDRAGELWDALLDAEAGAGLVPAGLGARDTLRLEAGMPLYGQELDRQTTPFEAGLGRVVKFDHPGEFVGRVALESAKDAPGKQLVGLRITDRGIARTGYPVYLPAAEAAVGKVTSGTLSPTLGEAIAMAYVPVDAAAEGTEFEVGIRNSRATAVVVPMPFYRRQT
jgi:aminomethyltransferase